MTSAPATSGIQVWLIRHPDGAEVEVAAFSWLSALGHAVEARSMPLPGRLATEQLPSGVVLARDISTGSTWVLKPYVQEPTAEDLFPREFTEDVFVCTESSDLGEDAPAAEDEDKDAEEMVVAVTDEEDAPSLDGWRPLMFEELHLGADDVEGEHGMTLQEEGKLCEPPAIVTVPQVTLRAGADVYEVCVTLRRA